MAEQSGGMWKHVITKADDLVTTQEETRAGFLRIALEKNLVGDPYVKSALAFRAMVAGISGPEELLTKTEVRPFMLAAAGLSDKSTQHLSEADQTAVIKELIEAFLKPAGELYIDQVICRYLLVKGDAVGGTMRNRIGALGQETLIRAILSCLDARNIAYDWMANQTRTFVRRPKTVDGTGIEKDMKALHWRSDRGDRLLGFNLKIPTVNKNVDLCLFAGGIEDYNKGRIVNCVDKTLMLGELKGGIDPAGADEHWKTASKALERIRTGFAAAGHAVPTSFVGAAIAAAMAQEIYAQLQDGSLSNAANLTNADQMTAYCNWLIEL